MTRCAYLQAVQVFVELAAARLTSPGLSSALALTLQPLARPWRPVIASPLSLDTLSLLGETVCSLFSITCSELVQAYTVTADGLLLAGDAGIREYCGVQVHYIFHRRRQGHSAIPRLPDRAARRALKLHGGV